MAGSRQVCVYCKIEEERGRQKMSSKKARRIAGDKTICLPIEEAIE
jgi:hypothetical protein